MIRKGTTPTQSFVLPFDSSKITAVKITYKQGNDIVLEKRLSDCSIEPDRITVRLSQEDTFKFVNAKPLQIQLRVVTIGGDALATKVYQEQVEQSLDEEVI